MRLFVGLFTVCLAVSLQASTTYISETGPGGLNVSVEPSQSVYVSWTQTITLTNIDILADLAASGGSPTGTAYLTNAFGPGTTSAANQVAINTTAPFTAGSVPAFQLLFSGITLPPGTYFLELTAPSPFPSDNNFWEASLPASNTSSTVSGVTFNGVGQSSGTGETQAGYLPSAAFTSLGTTAFDLEFIVRDSSAVPEPETFLPAALGLITLACLKSRRHFPLQWGNARVSSRHRRARRQRKDRAGRLPEQAPVAR